MKKFLLAFFTLISVASYSQVGISNSGTFTPTKTLDVDGDIRIRGDVIIDPLAPVSGTNWLIIDNTGTVGVSSSAPTGPTGATGPTGLLGTGTATGNTTYWDGTTWVLNNNNIYNAGSSVGIGTSSPTVKLDVNGAIKTNNGFIANDGSVLTPSIRFTNDANSGVYRSGTNSFGFVVGNKEIGRFSSTLSPVYTGFILGNNTSLVDGSLRFANATNTNTVTLSTGVTSASYTMVLPTAQGAANTFLKNDGSGNLSWAATPSITSVYGTSTLVVNSTITAFTLIPNLTSTISLQAGSLIHITSYGGVSPVNNSAGSNGSVDVALFITTPSTAAAYPTNGGYCRVNAAFSGTSGSTSSSLSGSLWTIDYYYIVPTTGNYTFQMRSVWNFGSANVSSSNTGARQGTLNIAILK
jgi:hypothetical protein